MHRNFTLALFLVFSATLIQAQVPELISDLNPNTESGLDEFNTAFISLGAKTILVANNGQTGLELFVLENNNLSLLKDIKPGPASSQPGSLTILGDKIYFVATDSTYGRELWVTDGTSGGTMLAQDLAPGTGSGNPTNLVASKTGVLFFERSHKLYSMVPGSAPVLLNAVPYIDLTPHYATLGKHIIPYKDGVALSAKGDMFGDSAYIFVSNGTAMGTRKVAALPGSSFGGIYGLMALDNQLLFSIANSFSPPDVVNGLYAVSGEPGEPAIRLLDASANSSLDVARFLPANGNLAFFYTVDGMYVTDGTIGGTLKLTNGLVSFLLQHDPFPFAWLQDKALFAVEQGSSTQLYTSYGSQAGTGVLKTINDIFVEQLVRYRDKIFFVSGTNNGFTPKIWTSDLSNAGTKTVYEYPGSSSISSIILLGFLDDYLYFQSNLDGVGRELYRIKVDVGVSTQQAPGITTAYKLEGAFGNEMYRILAPDENDKLDIGIFDMQGRLMQKWMVMPGEYFRTRSFNGMAVFVVYGKSGYQSFKVVRP